MAMRVFAVVRSIVVSAVFVSIWTWFVPRWVNGNHAFVEVRPFGWIVIALGLGVAFACALEFAWRGIGTPAPFDPPRSRSTKSRMPSPSSFNRTRRFGMRRQKLAVVSFG